MRKVWVRKIDSQRDWKWVQKMLLQELCLNGGELHFRLTIQFIILREERIVDEINDKEKGLKLKKMNLLYICSPVFFNLGNPGD